MNEIQGSARYPEMIFFSFEKALIPYSPFDNAEVCVVRFERPHFFAVCVPDIAHVFKGESNGT